MASNQSKLPDTTPVPLQTDTPNPPPHPPDHTQAPAVTSKPLVEIVPDTGQSQSAEEVKTTPPSVAKVASNGMQDTEAPHQGKESVKTDENIQTQTDPIPTTDTPQPVPTTELREPELSETTQLVMSKDVPQPMSDTPEHPEISENTKPVSSGEEVRIVPKNDTKQLTEPVQTEHIPLTTDNEPSVIATTDQVVITSHNTSTTQPTPSVVEVSDTKESVSLTNHSTPHTTDSQDPVSTPDTPATNIYSLPISIPLMATQDEIVISEPDKPATNINSLPISIPLMATQDEIVISEPDKPATNINSLPISIPLMATQDEIVVSEPDKPSEIPFAKKEQQLQISDVIVQSEEMVTDKIEPSPVPPVQAVVQEMEVTQPDMTSSSSDSLSRADCSTQSSELMHTDGEESVVITPADKQQDIVVINLVDKQQQDTIVITQVDKQQQDTIVINPVDKQQDIVVINLVDKQQQDTIVITQVDKQQQDTIVITQVDKQQQDTIVINPVDKQEEDTIVINLVDKQQEETVVMDVTTESPQQFTAPTPPDVCRPEKDLPTPNTISAVETSDEPMSPVCDTEVMQTDPVTVPLLTEGIQTEAPPLLQTHPIDTIVILDSPKPVPQEDMEVIDLTSETTPPCKRSKVSLATPVDSYPLNAPISKMHSDIQLLEQLINSYELLGNFSVQDQKISFSFLHKTDCIDCNLICLEDDYPQITLTKVSKQGEESDILSKRLPCVAWDVLRDCCSKQGIPVPPLDYLPPHLIELIQTSTGPLHTQVSTQSTTSQEASNYTGEDDDMDPSDDDDDYNFDEIDEEITMHPLLDKDIDRVRFKYGKDAIETRNYGGIGDIDIDLIIDMNFLEPEIARAWGVKHTVPLTFRLSLNAEHYLDGADIKVEVFQGDKGTTKGICKQIEKIVAQFISTSSKADKNPLCNTKVEDAMEAYLKLEQKLSERRKAISKSGVSIPEKKGVLAQFMDKFTKEKQIDCDMLVAQLVEMGWETELAVHALQECNMDLEKALDYLADEKTVESDEETNSKSYEKQKSRGAEVSDLSWMSDISDTKETALKSKMAPPLSHGFLCQVIQYILNRIPTLNDFCVICDDTHLFSNGAMLKPTVCARELCSFAFQTLGVMADVADSIATGPEVVELLVAMCNAASLSNRREDILDPYPTVVDPTNPRQFSIHPKEKDFKKIEKAMGHVVQELKALPAVLKDRLDALDSNSFPLLQWVLASNRCHIVKLTADRQIKSMGTTHQFLLLSAPPAKEAAFRKLKLKHKSVYAFHGSRLENWHSIMRNGLMNASGTKFQLHGAAYGAGIYLSPHASVSFGYSGIHGGQPSTAEKKKGRPTMLSSQNLNCIALCEVIDTSKIKKSGNIWVESESDHVVTRFFFVYEENTCGDTNFDTREEKYIKEIENAVKSLIQS